MIHLYCLHLRDLLEFTDARPQFLFYKTSLDIQPGIYILAIHPLGGGEFLSQLKIREEFEGGLEKRKGKGGNEEKKRKE